MQIQKYVQTTIADLLKYSENVQTQISIAIL